MNILGLFFLLLALCWPPERLRVKPWWQPAPRSVFLVLAVATFCVYPVRDFGRLVGWWA